jgi:hypothetical protein
MTFSKKQLEKLGTAYIVEQLYREGLRIALPDIDDGVDLIVYDQGESRPFISVPVQIKAFSNEEFFSDEKYLRIDGLFIVYLWHVGTGQAVQAFGMRYCEAEKIVDQHGWSRNKGRYVITRGTQSLRDALQPFAVDCWRKLFFG